MSLNSTIHTAHGITPFNIVFGRDPIMAIDHDRIQEEGMEPLHHVLQDMLLQQKMAISMAVKLHQRRDEKLKEIHDSTVKESQLVPGDIVFWNRPTIDPTLNKKLQNPYLGPFIVCERHPHGTVTLKDLHTTQYLPRQVSIKQLKRPSHYRKLPTEVPHDVQDDIQMGLAMAPEEPPINENPIQIPPQYVTKVPENNVLSEE
jgi:hypothetical protein